jgi:hypothetical protein
MNTRNARFLVAVLLANALLLGGVIFMRPFNAYAGSAAVPASPVAPAVSRREYLARLVAETAAHAAEDAATHPFKPTSAAVLPDDNNRISGDPRPD